MPATVPHSVQKRQPHSVPQSVYRIRMAPPREKELLKRNILRALRLRPGLSDMADKDAVRKLKDLGVIPGNAQRLMDSESSPRLSSIIEASRKLGVSIASLFDPGASDDALSAPAHTPWPFIRLSLEEWEGLEEWQRTLLEDAAMMKMRELRAELAAKESGQFRKRRAGD